MSVYRVIVGELLARTAVHVGSGAGRETTDDLCRRDAGGRFIIPGTAIGGALRSITTRLAPRLYDDGVCRALMSADETQMLPVEKRDEPCACRVCHLFGAVNPGEGGTEETGGRASRLFVAYARAHLPEGDTPRVRDAVGIDRRTRAAASESAAKFDLELLPAGTLFDLRLELEDADPEDERLLAASLAEWQAGRAWLGGRSARGLGAFELPKLSFKVLDLSSDENLIAYLRTDEPEQAARAEPDWLGRRLDEARDALNGRVAPRAEVARSFVSAEFDLVCDGLFLANDALAATRAGFDHAPLLDVTSRTGVPLLPGASLRGVLRAQAERIARTLATLETEGESEADAAQSFGRRCPACDPLRRPAGDEAAGALSLASCDALLRGVAPTDEETEEGLLCLACRLFGCERRGSRLRVEDTRGVERGRKRLDFLAIDRFTSGGRDGFKFDALASWQPTFGVRLHVENPAEWELGWLALTLRDLAEGMLTVGFGAAKGFGHVRAESFVVRHGYIGESDFAGPPELARRPPRATSGLYRVLTWKTDEAQEREELQSLARAWVEEFHTKRRGFERGREELQLTKDTYFGDGVSTLYPLRPNDV
jgi:CRISPR/Cas system CSM-associated protein Csm3 (group 7 of RAMP superfamily)